MGKTTMMGFRSTMALAEAESKLQTFSANPCHRRYSQYFLPLCGPLSVRGRRRHLTSMRLRAHDVPYAQVFAALAVGCTVGRSGRMSSLGSCCDRARYLELSKAVLDTVMMNCTLWRL